MQTPQQTPPPPAPSSARKQKAIGRLIVAAFVLLAGVFIWNQLPKGGYPTDLSRIGQGQAALVLTLNGNFMAGVEMMPVLDSLRQDFGDRAQFLVASMGLPEGQAFAQRHQTDDGSIVVFDPQGAPLVVLHGPRSADELRQVLSQAVQR